MPKSNIPFSPIAVIDGTVEIGWPISAEGGNQPRLAKLEEAKRRTKSLDPKRSPYQHILAVAEEREGKLEEEEEEESHYQTFLLHHINQLHHQHQPPQLSVPKKQKTATTTGQIVPVPGGHIVRSTGCKDRHSKVCTAKGLRDRRVRLSAHTAIEFYDVQDRLGYDRPSMAVDWLMKNAKGAIDELDHLPPWQPTSSSTGFQETLTTSTEPIANPMNSNAIESFFPPDLLSRTSSHAQDLRLSLQSFQDPTTANNMFSFNGSSGGGSGSIGEGGYFFGLPAPPQHSAIDHQFFTQREPLQSSTSPTSVPSWMDPIASPTAYHPSSSSVLGIEFGSGGGGFSGFRVPSWIQDSEEHDKPGSTHQ